MVQFIDPRGKKDSDGNYKFIGEKSTWMTASSSEVTQFDRLGPVVVASVLNEKTVSSTTTQEPEFTSTKFVKAEDIGPAELGSILFELEELGLLSTEDDE